MVTPFSGLCLPSSFAGEQTCDLSIREKPKETEKTPDYKSHNLCGEQYTEEGEPEKARRDVLALAADINSATQHGNDEKALQLAYLVFDHFREHDLLQHIKYGGVDADGNIVYVRPFPASFPTRIRRNHQGEIVDYTVDFQAMEKDISHNGVCEHLVIFSPWTDTPLFKIKISKELFIYWVNE